MRNTYIAELLLIIALLTIEACAPVSMPIPTPTSAPEPALTDTTTPTPSPPPASEPTQTPSPTTEQEPIHITTNANVLRVIDGDTIEVDINRTTFKVRYIGIDTPELDDKRAEVSALAQEATRYNRQLVEGKSVRLEKDVSETDKYGRLLRYVYFGELFVNAELVRSGYAQVATYPPDVKYQDLFLQLEREAKIAGRGLWVTPTPTPTPITPSVGASNILITRIFYDGLVRQVESDEYVEITNAGEQAQDLAGWILKDVSEGYPSFIFPSYVLAPGKSIRVYTNEHHLEWGGFSFEYSQAIWHNTEPDVAVLYNREGKEVSRKSY